MRVEWKGANDNVAQVRHVKMSFLAATRYEYAALGMIIGFFRQDLSNRALYRARLKGGG